MATKSSASIHPRALYRLGNALRECLRDIDLPPGKYIQFTSSVLDTDTRELVVRWEFTDMLPEEPDASES